MSMLFFLHPHPCHSVSNKSLSLLVVSRRYHLRMMLRPRRLLSAAAQTLPPPNCSGYFSTPRLWKPFEGPDAAEAVLRAPAFVPLYAKRPRPNVNKPVAAAKPIVGAKPVVATKPIVAEVVASPEVTTVTTADAAEVAEAARPQAVLQKENVPTALHTEQSVTVQASSIRTTEINEDEASRSTTETLLINDNANANAIAAPILITDSQNSPPVAVSATPPSASVVVLLTTPFSSEPDSVSPPSALPGLIPPTETTLTTSMDLANPSSIADVSVTTNNTPQKEGNTSSTANIPATLGESNVKPTLSTSLLVDSDSRSHNTNARVKGEETRVGSQQQHPPTSMKVALLNAPMKPSKPVIQSPSMRVVQTGKSASAPSDVRPSVTFPKPTTISVPPTTIATPSVSVAPVNPPSRPSTWMVYVNALSKIDLKIPFNVVESLTNARYRLLASKNEKLDRHASERIVKLIDELLPETRPPTTTFALTKSVHFADFLWIIATLVEQKQAGAKQTTTWISQIHAVLNSVNINSYFLPTDVFVSISASLTNLYLLAPVPLMDSSAHFATMAKLCHKIGNEDSTRLLELSLDDLILFAWALHHSGALGTEASTTSLHGWLSTLLTDRLSKGSRPSSIQYTQVLISVSPFFPSVKLYSLLNAVDWTQLSVVERLRIGCYLSPHFAQFSTKLFTTEVAPLVCLQSPAMALERYFFEHTCSSAPPSAMKGVIPETRPLMASRDKESSTDERDTSCPAALLDFIQNHVPNNEAEAYHGFMASMMLEQAETRSVMKLEAFLGEMSVQQYCQLAFVAGGLADQQFAVTKIFAKTSCQMVTQLENFGQLYLFESGHRRMHTLANGWWEALPKTLGASLGSVPPEEVYQWACNLIENTLFPLSLRVCMLERLVSAIGNHNSLSDKWKDPLIFSRIFSLLFDPTVKKGNFASWLLRIIDCIPYYGRMQLLTVNKKAERYYDSLLKLEGAVLQLLEQPNSLSKSGIVSLVSFFGAVNWRSELLFNQFSSRLKAEHPTSLNSGQVVEVLRVFADLQSFDHELFSMLISTFLAQKGAVSAYHRDEFIYILTCIDVVLSEPPKTSAIRPIDMRVLSTGTPALLPTQPTPVNYLLTPFNKETSGTLLLETLLDMKTIASRDTKEYLARSRAYLLATFDKNNSLVEKLIPYRKPAGSVKSPTISFLQIQVRAVLDQIGLEGAYEMEAILPSLCQVDFYLKERKLIIEVDGPHHYDQNNTPLMITAVKQRVHQRLGFDTKIVPYFDFPTTKTASHSYLQDLLGPIITNPHRSTGK